MKNLLKIMLSFLFYSIVSILSSSAYAALVISDNSLSLQLDRCSSPEVRDMVSESILNSGDVSVYETTENTALFKFRYPRNAIHENLTAQFIIYNSNKNEIARSSSKALHGSTAGFISEPVRNIDEDKYYVFIAAALNTDKKKYCTLKSETVTITNELTNSSPSLIRSDVTPSNIRVNESVTFQSIWQDPDSNYITDVTVRYRLIGTSSWSQEVLDAISGDVRTGYTFNLAVVMTQVGNYEVEFRASDSNGNTTAFQGRRTFTVTEDNNAAPTLNSSQVTPESLALNESVMFQSIWQDPDSNYITDVTVRYRLIGTSSWSQEVLDAISGDVRTGYTFNLAVVMTQVGNYEVEFRASDSNGNTTAFQGRRTFTVTEDNNAAPTLNSSQVTPESLALNESVMFQSIWQDPDSNYITDVTVRYRLIGTSSWSQEVLDAISGDVRTGYTFNLAVVMTQVGNYEVEFRASDSNGNTTAFQGRRTFTVTEDNNAAPTLNSSQVTPESLALNESVMFQSIWQDPDSNYITDVTVRYRLIGTSSWSQEVLDAISGDVRTGYTFNLAVVMTQVGNYEVEFRASDSNGNTTAFQGRRTFTVTEDNNAAPTLNSSQVTPESLALNESVMFQSIWQDPDSNYITDVTVRYRLIGTSSWSQEVLDAISGDVRTGYTFNLAVVMTQVGNYEVEFRASDSNGNTTAFQGRRTFTVTEDNNAAPTLNSSQVTPESLALNESVMFQSIWQDPDSNYITDVTVRYRLIGTSSWSQEVLDAISGDVRTGYTFNLAVVMTQVGNYEVEFRASDSNGNTTAFQGRRTFTVTEDNNAAPTLNSSQVTPESLALNESVTFQSIWQDPDSNYITDVTVRYRLIGTSSWSQEVLDAISGDVRTGYTFNLAVVMTQVGNYEVEFRASDSNGNTTAFKGRRTFTVTEDNNAAPTLNSSQVTPESLALNESVMFQSIWQDPDSNYITDVTVRYRLIGTSSWSQEVLDAISGDVRTGYTFNLAVVMTQVGNYEVEFRASDSNGNTTAFKGRRTFTVTETNPYKLLVTSQNGSVQGEGINCPSDCTESYTQESTHVSLTATPNESYKFSEWSLSESCASTADLTQLTINISFSSDCAVTASFIDAGSNPPLITSTDFPNCKSAGLEDIKCVKTGFEYNLSFFLTDVDGDLLTIEFEGYPNLDSKNISGSEVTLNEDIKFSNTLLSDCNSAWNMGLLDECWRKNITVKASVIDAKGYENTSEQTFTLYNLDKYWENETAIAKEKAQKDLDDLIAQKEHKNSAYIEFDEQYTELCVQEVYEPNFTNILIEDDKRRKENGNPIYTDIGNEYLITYNSKIKNKHPYSIEVKYNFGEFGTGHNYPAIVTLKYDIIGYPNNDGSSHSKSFYVNNYSDKELAKKLLLQSVYNNLFVGQCNEVDFDTPQLSSYEQTPEELALTISPSTESLKRQIYGDSFVDIALDIANGVDPDVAKEHLFDAFSGIDLQSRISLMVSNRPQDKLFFEFISNDDYLEQDDIDLTFALYHMTKVQLDPEYVIPNESFYLEIAGTYAFDTALDIVFPFIFDLVTLGMVETADASVKGKFRSFTRINERLDKKIINPKTLAKGARNAKTYTSARRGRRVHKSWEDNKLYDEKFGKTHIHEFSIKHPTLKTKTGRAKGYRLDAIKFDKKNNRIELRELKPNNPNAIRKGEKQLQEYKEVMEYLRKNDEEMIEEWGEWIKSANIILDKVVTYD